MNESTPRSGSKKWPSRVTAGRVAASRSSGATTSMPASGSNEPGRTSTVRLPRPRSRACSSSRSPSSGVEATSAAPTAAATARSYPGCTSTRESARAAPSSASARAAGGKPSRSAIACSSASRPRPGEPRALDQSRVDRRRSLAQPLEQRLRRLSTDVEALGGAPQPIQGAGAPLASAGRVGQRLLCPSALGEQGLQSRLRLGSLACQAGTAAARPLDLDVERPEVERRDSRLQRGDLDSELRGPLGRGRLERQRAQPLRHLDLDVTRTLDLGPDPRQLQLGTVAAALEAPEAGGLLDQLPALLGLRREDRLDPPLRDDRAHRRAEPDVGEKLDDVRAPHVRAVDEVLALATPVQPADDRDLGEVDAWQRAVLVVERELDLAMICPGSGRGSGEEDVVGLLGTQLARGKRPGRPDQRVGDVRLAGPVRPDDDRDARLEADLDRIGERLEAAKLDRAQMHASGKYRLPPGWAPSASTRSARAARRGPRARPPAPRPSWFDPCRRRPGAPSITAALVNWRSCAGPSTASTV